MNIITSLFSDLRAQRTTQARLTRSANVQLSQREGYAMMLAYYENNALYDLITGYLVSSGKTVTTRKGLRNPAFRVVEFYPMNVWPGELPNALEIEMVPTSRSGLDKDIQFVFDESNWGLNKETYVRNLALYGDAFIKIPQHADTRMPYLEVVNPMHVTAFRLDARDRVVKIRLDIPQDDDFRRVGLGQLNVNQYNVDYVTEVWDLDADTFEQWTHRQGPEAVITTLGTPGVKKSIRSDFGIPFLPFDHCKFRDVGQKNGANAFVLQIDKIDEVNNQATRLHHLLYRYNKAFLAIASNSVDDQGRPLPPPNIGRKTTKSGREGTVEVDNDMLLLPGMTQLTSTVPNISWDGHMASIRDMMIELAADMPELNYYNLLENNNINARAAFFKLGPAIQRIIETRGRAEQALQRSIRMALFIAGVANQMKKIDPVTMHSDETIKFRFKARPYLQMSDADKQEIELGKINLLVAKKNIGVDSRTLMKEAGYTDIQIDEIVKNKADELVQQQQIFAQQGQVIGSQALTNEQKNGQAPGFNKGAQTGPTQPNGNPTVAPGMKG